MLLHLIDVIGSFENPAVELLVAIGIVVIGDGVLPARKGGSIGRIKRALRAAEAVTETAGV